MKQIVEEILSGKFNNDTGALDFSCPKIELTLLQDTVYEGSFKIYGPAGKVTEGYVVSSDLRMQCITRTFDGSEDEILYCFDASSVEAGTEVKGAFHIISNHGEHYLPYTVSVITKTITSSLGNIKNLFHFTNLAKSNWEEAVKLFYSEDFKQIFTGNDAKYYAAYKGLSVTKKNPRNVEEFLLEINKKQPVELILEESEIKIEDPTEGARFCLVINRNGWGYVGFSVESEGGFIKTEVDSVSEDAFLGNIYRLYYYIDSKQLHAGNNYGAILLKQDEKTIRVPVRVSYRVSARKLRIVWKEKRQLTVSLMEYYQAYRLKKISSVTWKNETSRLLSRMLEIDDKDIMANLFQAQLLLTEERYNEAKWCIEKQEEQVLRMQVDKPELWCYYLYLTTLYSKDESYVDEVSAVVEGVYERNRGNWRIAWLLLFLSEEYAKSPSKKWMLLEELFYEGGISPVLYVEAWHLLNQNPALLLKFDAFEQQIVWYAVKHDLLKEEVMMQVVYLAQKQKDFSEMVLRILQGCYEKMPQTDTLCAICTLLIKGNCTKESYFPWYKLGVEQNLRITRLYEYYMMALPRDFSGQLPKMVLMYFAYQSDLQYEKKAFLYHYVHKNKETIPDIYGNYALEIERFLLEQIRLGRINEDLAYLYRNAIHLPMIDEETAVKLVPLLFTSELYVDAEQIKEAVVVYPHCKGESVYPVNEGRVRMPLYTSDCKILLGDGKGNRYTVSVPYEQKKLMNPAKLSLMVAPFVRNHLGYQLYVCCEYQNVMAIHDDNEDLFAGLAENEMVEDDLRKTIRFMLIKYYYDKDKMRELDALLSVINPKDIASCDRKNVIRYLVTRGMYEEAFAWVKQYGPYENDPKTLVRLCSRMLARQDVWERDDFLLGIAGYTLSRGKYEETILQYLVRFYEGGIRDMRNIWKTALSYGVDTYYLCERMLIQMLYTGAYVGEKYEILQCYCLGGGKEEILAAFLSQCCYDYAVREKVMEPFVFEKVAKLYKEGMPVHFVCEMAYLQYYAEHKEEREKADREVINQFLRDLLSRQMVLPLYKEYQNQIPELNSYVDKTILEYRTKPGGKAVIHYVIQDETEQENEYCTEPMQDIFGGICVKECTLFFGERMQYYITEEADGQETLTQSSTIHKSDIGQENFEGRFSILNDIMIGKTLQDYDTVNKLLQEYYRQDFVTDKLFTIR